MQVFSYPSPDLLVWLTSRRQVLSEVKRPKKIFAKATISAACSVIVLFMLVHIAYVRPLDRSAMSDHGLRI